MNKRPTRNSKGRSASDPFLKPQIFRLQRRLNLETPGFQKGFRNVLGVLVAPRPLAQASGPQILIRGELVLTHNLFKFGDSGSNRADGLRLTPVWISAPLRHENC